MTEIILIAAYAKNRVIGLNGDMPWHLPADLKRFKKVTSGNSIIMGRKTFQSIGRALPNRRNIVISRNTEFKADKIEIANSLEAALLMVAGEEKAFVIGGGQIYASALPHAEILDVCEIDLETDGDAYFPDFSQQGFVEETREPFRASGDTPAYSFVRYRRQT